MAEIQKLYANEEQFYPETSIDAIVDPSTGEKFNFSSSIIDTTYSELAQLRNSSKLTPSQYYKITDYETIVQGENITSANHPFDVIVQAITENTFSENAQVCQTTRSGGDYFDNCKLNSWKIKYCFDNDTSKYGWASNSGKGVIYRMIDDRNNDCPYDFKNIKTYDKYTFSIDDNGSISDFSVYSSNNGFSSRSCSNNTILACAEYSNDKQRVNYINITVAQEKIDDDSSWNVSNNYFGLNCRDITITGLLYNCIFRGTCEMIIANGYISNVIFGHQSIEIYLDNGCEDCVFGSFVRRLNFKKYACNVIVESGNYGGNASGIKYTMSVDSTGDIRNLTIKSGTVSDKVETVNVIDTDQCKVIYRNSEGNIVQCLENQANIQTITQTITGSDSNNANLSGYYGALESFGIKSGNIKLESLTVYRRSGTAQGNYNVRCKVLGVKNGSWYLIAKSSNTENISTKTIAGEPIKFNMVMEENIPVLSSKDTIGIIFSNQEISSSNLGHGVIVSLKTMSGIKGGINKGENFNGTIDPNPSVYNYSPAITFEYYSYSNDDSIVHLDKDETINSIKTFNGNISIANKTLISSGIDSGELKVFPQGSNTTKGFIIRSANRGDTIPTVDILATNTQSSYTYSFPKKSGTVALLTDIPNTYTKTEIENKIAEAIVSTINSSY